jgi:hypothetical protein
MSVAQRQDAELPVQHLLELRAPLGQQQDVLIEQLPLLGLVQHVQNGCAAFLRGRDVLCQAVLLLQVQQLLQRDRDVALRAADFEWSSIVLNPMCTHCRKQPRTPSSECLAAAMSASSLT